MGANEEVRKLYGILKDVRERLKALEQTEHPSAGQTPTAPASQGDMIVANSTPKWGVLACGGAHFLLKVNAAGTTPAYEAYDWDLIAAASGADMVHGHTSDVEGGLLPQYIRSDADDASTGRTQWSGASNGDGYNQASIEIVQVYGASLDAPHISFHYSGSVASQIGFFKGDSSGDICILIGVGTGYETLRALTYKWYYGTTLMGELSAQDAIWTRINQNVVKNIYTPRYIVAESGLVAGTSAQVPGTGDVCYSGQLNSYKNSVQYNVYAFLYRSSPLTSTSWDGDARSTTGKTLIDLSSVFGVPAGVEAISSRLIIQDSGAGATDCWIILGNNTTSGEGLGARCAPSNDRYVDSSVLSPCTAAGDTYYQIGASGTLTMDVFIRIWGYAL